MKEKKITIFESGLIWFGAAVSIAEILTGTYLAPLGFAKGLLAIIIGHIIGVTVLFLAGYMGGKTGKSAMGTVKMSFGQIGMMLFAAMNLIQLFGWTAIMIYDGAISANNIWAIGDGIWSVIIGGLIVLWLLIGIRNLGKLNLFAMAALFILTVVLCYVIFGEGIPHSLGNESLSFGMALELSVAMPLSWLPLLSDYTREADSPFGATLVSAVVYGLVSAWMYLIGMGIAIYTEESDIAQIMLKAGLGSIGLLVIVFSTVTTTYLDAWSAGISGEAIWDKISAKPLAVFTAIAGTICAVFFPITNLMDFLYLIGSVFAPMIAVQIVDFYIIKQDFSMQKLSIHNLLIWLIGFVLYRFLLQIEFVFGSTLLAMAFTGILCLMFNLTFRKKRRAKL